MVVVDAFAHIAVASHGIGIMVQVDAHLQRGIGVLVLAELRTLLCRYAVLLSQIVQPGRAFDVVVAAHEGDRQHLE